MSVTAVESRHWIMECSRTTGSHCDEELTPSNNTSSWSKPIAITGNYKCIHIPHITTAVAAILPVVESGKKWFSGEGGGRSVGLPFPFHNNKVQMRVRVYGERVFRRKPTFIIVSTSVRLADWIDAVSSLYVDIWTWWQMTGRIAISCLVSTTHRQKC